MGKSQPGLFNPVEFSARLKAERQRTGLNQKDFGQIAGVGLQTQSRYETSETQPNAEYLAALAQAGVDILYLLTGQRSEGPRLSRETSDLVTELEQLPKHMREAALTVVKALRKSAEPSEPGPTMHGGQQDYRVEEHR